MRCACWQRPPNQIWGHITECLLRPHHNFESVHAYLAAAVYGEWPAAALGPPPLWLPHPALAQQTNVARFMSTFDVS